MTVSEVKTEVLSFLADSGIAYTDQGLTDSIQDAYHQVTSLTRCIEKQGSISQVANQVYYDFYHLITDYMHVFAIKNDTTGKWLQHATMLQLEGFGEKWETEVGDPYLYSVIDYRYVAIFPHKASVSSETFTVFYKAKGTSIDDSTTLDIPAPYESVITNYVIVDMFEKAQELTKAQLYNQEYLTELRHLQRYINERDIGAKILAKREQVIGGLTR